MGKIKTSAKCVSERRLISSPRPNKIKKLGTRNRMKIAKKVRKNARVNTISKTLVNSYIEEKLNKIVLKLLGDETIEEIDGFVEEWEYFQDIDLIILGSPNDEYKEYTDLLREEYNTMELENYHSMRSKVLRTFLTIPFIYSSKLFRDKFEEKARTNIKNEIAELNGK